MGQLILLRHGQSLWNKLNIFTGWVDIPLSSEGIQQALQAGELLSEVPIDLIFTSTLVRAQMTAFLAMSAHQSGRVPMVHHRGEGKLDAWGQAHGEAGRKGTVPVICAWELNERMYGELQGCNKAETAKQYGAQQVQIWRRSYDQKPPGGESLKDTAARTLPYFDAQVLPQVQAGKTVLVSAHGNSLRSIIMELDQLSPEEVVNLEVPLGEPITYQFKNNALVR
jgi:2,3-bisphosphoglycerate-dependent phosphoglycerate mutase